MMDGESGGASSCCPPAATSGGAAQKAIKIPNEPVLDGVLEEDRVSVRNIIYVLHALKLCSSWSVTPKNQGYEVVGLVNTKAANQEVEFRDMELIKRVDPLRVHSVIARVIGDTLNLVIFLFRKSEPVVLEEQEIVQIQRKRKFWWGS